MWKVKKSQDCMQLRVQQAAGGVKYYRAAELLFPSELFQGVFAGKNVAEEEPWA